MKFVHMYSQRLLRAREFVGKPRQFRFLDIAGNWQETDVPAGGLAFTWCQVPVIYELNDSDGLALTVAWHDGETQTFPELALSSAISVELFQRSGRIRQLTVKFGTNLLFAE